MVCLFRARKRARRAGDKVCLPRFFKCGAMGAPAAREGLRKGQGDMYERKERMDDGKWLFEE